MPPTFMPNIQWTLLKKKSYTKLQKNISTGLSPSTVLKFQKEFNLPKKAKSKVYTPHLPQITKRDSVCSTSISLAVTNDIAIAFFSSTY